MGEMLLGLPEAKNIEVTKYSVLLVNRKTKVRREKTLSGKRRKLNPNVYRGSDVLL